MVNPWKVAAEVAAAFVVGWFVGAVVTVAVASYAVLRDLDY